MRLLIIVCLVLAQGISAWALGPPVRIDEGRPYVQARLLAPAPANPAADPNDAILGYDTGPMYFFPDATAIGSLWGVRFSPVQACSLLSIQLYAYEGGGQVKFRFYRDAGGQPGVEFGTPQIRTLVGDLTLETVTLTPADMGAADFYIMMEIISGPPPYPVTDADGGTGRSWFRYPAQDWEHVVDFDINIRAGVRYYGDDLAGPEIVHIPVTLGFSQAYSTEVRCGLNDLSGIREGWVYHRTKGTTPFDSTRLHYQFDNEWQAEIPPRPAGTDVEYFIRAYDGSPTGNLGTFPLGAPAVLLTYRVHPGMELRYDDGYPEMFFFIDTAWYENSFAVRMTPPTYPVKVNLLRAYVTDTSEFEFEVRAMAGDSLGALLAGPFTARSSDAFGWADLVIPEHLQPTIHSGEFFAVFKWKPWAPTDPAVGADTLAAASGRSYSYDTQFGWYQYDQFDWQIRAAVATPTGIVELGGPELPRTFTLEQNIPNPFNPSTRIDFALTEPSQVNLTIFNLLGQKVRTLVDEYLPAGNYRADFDARDDHGRGLPSGLYFYRLEAGGAHNTRKMILMR